MADTRGFDRILPTKILIKSGFMGFIGFYRRFPEAGGTPNHSSHLTRS